MWSQLQIRNTLSSVLAQNRFLRDPRVRPTHTCFINGGEDWNARECSLCHWLPLIGDGTNANLITRLATVISCARNVQRALSRYVANKWRVEVPRRVQEKCRVFLALVPLVSTGHRTKLNEIKWTASFFSRLAEARWRNPLSTQSLTLRHVQMDKQVSLRWRTANGNTASRDSKINVLLTHKSHTQWLPREVAAHSLHFIAEVISPPSVPVKRACERRKQDVRAEYKFISGG